MRATRPAAATDPYDLQRFVDAQEHVYGPALSEIKSGLKRSHWMWFIFPQFRGLGVSRTSERFALKSVAEARAYLAHPVLGQRLVECAEAILEVSDRSAFEILGSPDDLKLRSCATLFACASPEIPAFQRVLDKYFRGQRDDRTLHLMARADQT